jgi:Domain of unknown function (DUF4224)
MFLTADQVQQLTGYRRPTAQRAWLDRNLVPYFVAASGRPIILRSSLDALHNPRSNGTTAHPGLRLATANVPARPGVVLRRR